MSEEESPLEREKIALGRSILTRINAELQPSQFTPQS